jgi:hypothetical protein
MWQHRIDMDTRSPLTSEQAREAFMTYFNTFNYLTPEQRRQVDTMFATAAPSSFAAQTNQDVYTDLFARAEAGNLTVVGLNAARGSITPENYTTLLARSAQRQTMRWSMRSVWCSCGLGMMQRWQWTQRAPSRRKLRISLSPLSLSRWLQRAAPRATR